MRLLTNSKGHEVFRLADLALLVEEPFRLELLGLVPELRIHMHSVEERDNVGILGDNVTSQLCFSKTNKNNNKISWFYLF